MINPGQFYHYIIVPTLDRLGLYSPGAAELLLGTALVESNLEFIRQWPDGPALGVYQMEPTTHADIWNNFLAFRTDLGQQVAREAQVQYQTAPCAQQMEGNAYYATAMARCHYYRYPERLPAAGQWDKMAALWKKRYNTYQPGQTHTYVTSQINRFTDRMAKAWPSVVRVG